MAMGRRLFTALSVLSLLLSAMNLAMWVRSYWRSDEFGYGGNALVSGGAARYWRIDSATAASTSISTVRTSKTRQTPRGARRLESSATTSTNIRDTRIPI